MKKLTNVSPFILLLVPVFVMMILTFTSVKENSNEGVAFKTSSSVSPLRAVVALFK